jgi:hypothetical protein
MNRQRRPTGPLWPTPPKWKERVIKTMDERRVSKADLARALAVSSTAISDLLGPESKSSRLVPRVHRALGLPPPAPPSTDPRAIDALLAELLDLWPTLDDDDRAMLMSIARRVRPDQH